jgi:steroid 5-alpha reductase family enzyme
MLSQAQYLLLIGGTAVCVLMLGLWLIHLPIRNAGIVDIGWALGLAILAALYASLGPGFGPRKWLIAAMAAIWAVRLAWHLFRRIVGHPEEGRYQQLRKEWGTKIEIKFLGFFEFQAFLDLVLSLPFLLAALNPKPELSWLEFAGTGVWLIAVFGESIADAQLARFKRDPQSRGKVCDTGLWKYSRHPNYFFEWLIWLAWALYALASPYGWIALLCPALMLYFLFKVTGIPATEAQALRSKGEAYRRYQETTSAFVPWFPSSSATITGDRG